MIKPLIVSHSDVMGGAARAAYRLHRSLLSSGIESGMYVGQKGTGDWRVIGPATRASKAISQLRPVMDEMPVRLQSSPRQVLHSPAWISGADLAILNSPDFDVVNLHWVCRGFLSIEAVRKITKPIVWTLHDMWTFCGAEHYTDDDPSSRWRTGYARSNREPAEAGVDINRWTWRRKQRAWRRPVQLVSPSRWLARCASQAALTRDWPVEVIPNAIDTFVYKPIDKKSARFILNLPQDVKIVLFGAVGGTTDPRKGWHYLSTALSILGSERQDLLGVVFGEEEPKVVPRLGVRLKWMGKVTDDEKLALLYSAADVMVVPSEQENLPQAATEAATCGCPVVLFNSFGMADVCEHKVTGYLARAYDASDLKNGISWILDDEARAKQIGQHARGFAQKSWSYEVISSKYLAVCARVASGQ